MGKYSKMPKKTFQEIQFGACMILSAFNPVEATVTPESILGATSGGVTFTDTPTFIDFGEDIDNCPKNTKELKRIDSREVKTSGNFVTVNAALIKKLMACADISETKITPRDEILAEDFADLWLVGDYSDKTGATNGGYIAIHLKNVLSNGGFQMTTTSKNKGMFAFDFMAHYSLAEQGTAPYEVYLKAGTAEPGIGA